ncbi:MAG: DEAD/DEAH box helicase, partial [Pseudomonas sp.]
MRQGFISTGEYMFRSQEQANFSAIISRHMAQTDGPLLLEGTTGLGKTRAYLAAVMKAAASGKRITIALPSHQLIDQLLLSSDLSATHLDGMRVAAFRPARWFDRPEAYRAQRSAAMDAAVMICTSAAVIIDQRLKGGYNGATERDYIVFDEADQLPDAAALQSDCEITRQQLKELGVVAESAAQAAREVLKNKGLEPEVKAAALMILEAVAEPAWFYQAGVTDDGGIMLFHKMPGRLLKRIANRNEVAFISATLTVAGRFDDFKRALGIQKQSDLSTIVEPEKHGQLEFVIADAEVDSPEWLELSKETIKQAINHGPVLVVTPSHTLAETLGKMVEGATVRSADETASQAAARMGDSKVLIAAGAWAGLDTPIPWKTIVVPRVPYERPVILDDEVESRYLDTRNTAVRRLRQVIGRGLRAPEAVCKVYVLDRRYRNVEAFVPKRFQTQWLGRVFLEGQRREVTLSKIERDPAVRKAALTHYGLKCMSCGFVPKVVSQLEVHHLNPLANGGERLTGLSVVAVLCANCHRWAH